MKMFINLPINDNQCEIAADCDISSSPFAAPRKVSFASSEASLTGIRRFDKNRSVSDSDSVAMILLHPRGMRTVESNSRTTDSSRDCASIFSGSLTSSSCVKCKKKKSSSWNSTTTSKDRDFLLNSPMHRSKHSSNPNLSRAEDLLFASFGMTSNNENVWSDPRVNFTSEEEPAEVLLVQMREKELLAWSEASEKAQKFIKAEFEAEECANRSEANSFESHSHFLYKTYDCDAQSRLVPNPSLLHLSTLQRLQTRQCVHLEIIESDDELDEEVVCPDKHNTHDYSGPRNAKHRHFDILLEKNVNGMKIPQFEDSFSGASRQLMYHRLFHDKSNRSRVSILARQA